MRAAARGGGVCDSRACGLQGRAGRLGIAKIAPLGTSFVRSSREDPAIFVRPLFTPQLSPARAARHASPAAPHAPHRCSCIPQSALEARHTLLTRYRPLFTVKNSPLSSHLSETTNAKQKLQTSLTAATRHQTWPAVPPASGAAAWMTAATRTSLPATRFACRRPYSPLNAAYL